MESKGDGRSEGIENESSEMWRREEKRRQRERKEDRNDIKGKLQIKEEIHQRVKDKEMEIKSKERGTKGKMLKVLKEKNNRLRRRSRR